MVRDRFRRHVQGYREVRRGERFPDGEQADVSGALAGSKDNKRKVGGTVYYKVYGLTQEALTCPVPVVCDMDVETGNEGFIYDE